MYMLVLLNRLLGWALLHLMGSNFGSSGSSFLVMLMGAMTFFLSFELVLDVVFGANMLFSSYWTWLMIGDVNIEIGLLFDTVTSLMMVVVTGVSMLVYIYSVDYMSGDPHMISFLSYLSLFSFFMVVLVTAPNYLQMFMGWEGVGLASYLLINFWSSSLLANKAAFKAMVFNSVGDYCLSLGICITQVVFGSVSYSMVLGTVGYFIHYQFMLINLTGLLFFMAACGKSAQLGLHFWLRDAMEGRTRVSALIHAATMVTAGMYVLISSSPLLEFTPSILVVVTFMGGLTAILSAIMGVAQTDMKKMMAFSTCSQLGYMVLSCGLSLYDVSLFHLMTHAVFKALLFLGAGSIIHSISDEQQVGSYGSFISWLPWTYTCILVASLSLGGIRFLSGFYSKDTILELVSTNMESWVLSLWLLDTLGACLTAVYSASLMVLAFFVSPSAGYIYYMLPISEGGGLMMIVFMRLSILSMILGYSMEVLVMGEGSDIYSNSIFMSLEGTYRFLDHHWTFQYMKILPTVLSLLVMFFSLFILYYSLEYFYPSLSLFSWMVSSLYLDSLVCIVTNNFMKASYSSTYQMLDKGFMDIVGPTGMRKMSDMIEHKSKEFTSGYMYINIFWILSFVVTGMMVF